tara:strand:+ start:543 stop:1415 length:873 start_codon:yes stop_codon:yes gene_type:complete
MIQDAILENIWVKLQKEIKMAITTVFRGTKLNESFLKRASIQTSFNVEDADLTNLQYKKEMQYLYSLQFFGNEFFVKNKPLTGNSVNVRAFNQLATKLKNANPSGYKNLVQFTGQYLGPGEVLLYVLHDKLYLAGGTTGGDASIDFSKNNAVVGQNVYEVKGVKIRKMSNEYEGFSLGGTVPMEKIIGRVLSLKEELGISQSTAKSDVTFKEIEEMHKQRPAEMQNLEKEFGELCRKHYFSKYKIMFMRAQKSDVNKPDYGHILDIKDVQANEVRMQTYTRKNMKVLVKV